MKSQNEVETLLRSLRLSTFLTNYKSFAERASKERLGHIDYLYELAKLEDDARVNRRIETLLKQATLPRGKTLKEFDLAIHPGLSPGRIKDLAEGSCLDHYENILIFGNPGTGKSHLCAAIGREWCLRGRKVLYTSASALVQKLLAAKRDLNLNDYIKELEKFQAIIIDDISYIPHTRDETDVLFILLAERYERLSVVITSNLMFSQWHTIFKDPMTTRAAIDRLVHHATILELNGDSYRQRAAKQRKQQQEAATTGQQRR